METSIPTVTVDTVNLSFLPLEISLAVLPPCHLVKNLKQKENESRRKTERNKKKVQILLINKKYYPDSFIKIPIS